MGHCRKCASELTKPTQLRFCSRACAARYSAPFRIIPRRDRFEARVDRSGDCHIWTGGLFSNGYGQFNWSGGPVGAHRAAFRLEHGRWPRPMCLHKCNTRHCVNPAHIYEGSARENAEDARKAGTLPHGESQGLARLTDEAVKVIDRGRASGMTNVDLAALLGVSSSTVSSAYHRKTWKHVTKEAV